MSKPRVRSPEYIERKLRRDAEKRKAAREALGFKSAQEFRAFAQRKALELIAARKAAAKPVAVQPSIAKRQAMQANTGPLMSSTEWEAKGGLPEASP